MLLAGYQLQMNLNPNQSLVILKATSIAGGKKVLHLTDSKAPIWNARKNKQMQIQRENIIYTK